jgi:hypothetical protein
VEALHLFISSFADLPVSWSAQNDPCGYPDCGHDTPTICFWEGIACKNWRIIKIASPLCIPNKLVPCRQVSGTFNQELNFDDNSTTTRAFLNLQIIDFKHSKITGDLPRTWANITSLEKVDVTGSSSISGSLPHTWGELPNLTSLDVSKTGISGSLPWAYNSLQNITYINLEGNCGMCGTLSTNLTTRAVVLTKGTSIGFACSTSNCNSLALGFLAQAVIVLAIILILVFSCCWRRCYLFSNYAAVPEEGRGWRLVHNVLTPQRAPRGGWREGGGEEEEEEEEEEEGADGTNHSNHSVNSNDDDVGDKDGRSINAVLPIIIIVMPDGNELCTARIDEGFLEAAAASAKKKEKVDREEEEQLKISSNSWTAGVVALDIKESNGSQSGEPSSSSSIVGSPSSSSSAASSIVGDREPHRPPVGMVHLPPPTQQQQQEEEGRRRSQDPTDDAAVDRSERGTIATNGTTGRGERSTTAGSRPPTRRSHSHRQPIRRIPIMYKIELDGASQANEDDQL